MALKFTNNHFSALALCINLIINIILWLFFIFRFCFTKFLPISFFCLFSNSKRGEKCKREKKLFLKLYLNFPLRKRNSKNKKPKIKNINETWVHLKRFIKNNLSTTKKLNAFDALNYPWKRYKQVSESPTCNKNSYRKVLENCTFTQSPQPKSQRGSLNIGNPLLLKDSSSGEWKGMKEGS